MNLKPLQESNDIKKTQAIDVHSDWNVQTNHYFSKLLSRYPTKKITLEEARELLNSRLGDQELSEIVRQIRAEQ